jgi:dihydroorotate dehydrogenase (NAD+) catalytic subunit
MNLEVEVANIKFKNQVMAASGTFGYAQEYEELVDLEKIGGIVTKSITLEPISGNPPPRICEVACGMLNSIGLQNEGLPKFLEEKLPFLRKIGTNVIVSIAGLKAEAYVKMAQTLSKEEGICAIELNLSCPNIKNRRGRVLEILHFGQDEKTLYSLVKKVRKKSKLPIFVKLTPNVTDITFLAKAAEKAGADALTLINTPLAMAVDIHKKTPKLKSIMGGLSGPAIKPIALRAVWQVAQVVKIPIIGVGGISSWEDAIEFILCGATLIQIGTATFLNPDTLINVIEGIKTYLKKHNLNSPKDLIGDLIYK